MGNHIDHIEITNFKSIRHQKIEGCKRINVFIGYPNVGKSAILEAIASLSYLQRDFFEPLANLCRFKFSNELFYDGDIKKRIEVNYSQNIRVEFEYLTEREVEYSVKIKNEEYTPTYGSAYGVKEWNIYKTITFNKDERNVSQNNADKDVIKIRKYHFQNQFNEFKTNGLMLSSPFGENLVDIVQFNKELRKEVGGLFKDYNLKLLIDQATNSIRGLKQLDDETIFTIPFYQMADTLQRLVFHKAAIMSNENSVLLFEEPESHMFPPYVSNLVGDIVSDKNNNQYFIATHSPFVLNDLMEDAKDELSIYAVGLHNGETTINLITKEQMHEIYQYGIDLFFNLEDYLKDA